MEPHPEHTLGSHCRLAPVKHEPLPHGRPPIEAQFFYASVIPIDDPLSTGAGTAQPSKNQIRPFARGDNNALEKAWLSLSKEDEGTTHDAVRHSRPLAEDEVKRMRRTRERVVSSIARKHHEKHKNIPAMALEEEVAMPLGDGLPSTPTPACCNELAMDVAQELGRVFCAVVRKHTPELEAESLAHEVVRAMSRMRQASSASKQSSHVTFTDGNSSAGLPSTKRFGVRDEELKGRRRASSQPVQPPPRKETPPSSSVQAKPIHNDDGISGKPFMRVEPGGSTSVGSSPLRSGFTMPRDSALSSPSTGRPLEIRSMAPEEPREEQALRQMEEMESSPVADGTELPDESLQISVGVSRLHMVTLPELQMKPIYWSPVNDMAVVTRGTWFYWDTMLPLAPAVANQVEAGYHELRPWTETWHDELRCAVEVGPEGEEKVSHSLWPAPLPTSKRKPGQPLPREPLLSTDTYCAARCFKGEAAAEGSIDPIRAENTDEDDSAPKPFASYHVIYKNTNEAFLLKPSLKPSAYYGRRPVQKIMKGHDVGIHVVRGFQRNRWNALHAKKPTASGPAGETRTSGQRDPGPTEAGACAACQHDQECGQVTDLILVAHGIGQKFAERVESFHFTHAINAFRRSVNTELNGPVLKDVIRDGQNGMMILPLNWRMGLSFEDGGPLTEDDVKHGSSSHAYEGFGLKDIEPKTIPAVRSMISDVMFDIPFYMSHHKGKMISALVSEANRVYRLWCRNNPGFAEKGRVHMIGHSLGSAMAIEVLSHQPTWVPHPNLAQPEPETQFFEFNTCNLFLVGSPAGFFLLLNRGALLPRRGREKPGADSEALESLAITGEAGTHGCIAVDNVYNILAKEDPIAYLLNGAIDPHYASSLRTAHVPSLSPTLFTSLRSIVPGLQPSHPFAPSTSLTADSTARPNTQRLPSQLELEVHDFTREEVAEKKAYLLNDNGQVDWYLRSGGGPLEIQYLNMLSAHTSYWGNLDFVRFLCAEVGRKPGRANTIPVLRAAKAKRVIPG